MTAWPEIVAAIGAASGTPFELAERTSAGGGCINTAYTLRGHDGRRVFVKLNRAERLAMFEAEAAGLEALRASGAIRVPRPICTGAAGGEAWLVLEQLDLGGHGDARQLGRQLAALHRTSQARFGWHRDNTLGDTPQPNTLADDWVTFWREQRLGHQLRLAKGQRAGRDLIEDGERLLGALPTFFSDYRPMPSLLHGDLWGGNYAFAEGGPVLFDPAVYYGDREADLAMTELFGGFPADFYAAYREAWPLDPGYAVRKTLYNLYHVLNHFNMFGGGYGSQARGMMQRLLAETRP